jgi:hypothetical protein
MTLSQVMQYAIGNPLPVVAVVCVLMAYTLLLIMLMAPYPDVTTLTPWAKEKVLSTAKEEQIICAILAMVLVLIAVIAFIVQTINNPLGVLL